MMKWLIKSDYKSKLPDLIWNSLGCGINAIQMAFILIFISRWNQIELVGMINIGYSLAGFFATLGRFGVRNYQVTDKSADKNARDYLFTRYVTIAGALILSVLYLMFQMFTGKYSTYKCILVLLIILLRCVDCVEGSYLGQFQKMGKFVIGTKIAFLHQVITLAALTVFVVLGVDILLAFGLTIIISYVSNVFLFEHVDKQLHFFSEKRHTFRQVGTILKDCFPLCIGTTLAIFIGNIPKYVIDWYLNERIQAIFGYITLPIFVVTMVSQFIYQPFVKELGDLWSANKIRKFIKRILIQCSIVIAVAAVIFIFCYLIGLNILSSIYNENLQEYRIEFCVLLLGGTLYSLAYYLTIPITAMRKQKYIAFGYIGTVIISVIIQKNIVMTYGMIGAAWLYVLLNAVLVIMFVVIVAFFAKKRINEYKQ